MTIWIPLLILTGVLGLASLTCLVIAIAKEDIRDISGVPMRPPEDLQ